MKQFYFCEACKQIFKSSDACRCDGKIIKPVKLGTPVNIVGTKLKGKIYRMKEDALDVLITSTKNKGIQTYPIDQVRKVL
ncbi:MAG: hypothetical protein ACRCW2_10600 [Cellulosilyticaceae bacterium]